MNWQALLKQLDPPHHIWFEETDCAISTDGLTALIICRDERSSAFVDQLYFLTKIYPLIKSVHPTVQHLRVVHGSIYDLVKTQDAVIVSFQ